MTIIFTRYYFECPAACRQLRTSHFPRVVPPPRSIVVIVPKLEIVKELFGQLELVQIGEVSAASENNDPTAILEIEGNGQLIHFDLLLDAALGILVGLQQRHLRPALAKHGIHVNVANADVEHPERDRVKAVEVVLEAYYHFDLA